MMRPLSLLCLAVLLPACDVAAPEVGDLALQVVAPPAVARTEIRAFVSNESGRALYLYDCGGRVLLDIEAGPDWETVGFVNNDCPQDPIVPFRLNSGETETVSFVVESPGTYRLQTFFGTAPGGEGVSRADWVSAVSEEFVVASP